MLLLSPLLPRLQLRQSQLQLLLLLLLPPLLLQSLLLSLSSRPLHRQRRWQRRTIRLHFHPAHFPRSRWQRLRRLLRLLHLLLLFPLLLLLLSRSQLLLPLLPSSPLRRSWLQQQQQRRRRDKRRLCTRPSKRLPRLLPLRLLLLPSLP
jgi:hypothetical protein